MTEFEALDWRERWPQEAGAYVRAWRKRMGWTQAQLASALDSTASKRTIENWEGGKRVPPEFLRNALTDIERLRDELVREGINRWWSKRLIEDTHRSGIPEIHIHAQLYFLAWVDLRRLQAAKQDTRAAKIFAFQQTDEFRAFLQRAGLSPSLVDAWLLKYGRANSEIEQQWSRRHEAIVAATRTLRGPDGRLHVAEYPPEEDEPLETTD